MLSRVTAKNVGDVFLRHSVVLLSLYISPALLNRCTLVTDVDGAWCTACHLEK